MRGELFACPLRQKHVVDVRANLPGVEHFHPHDPLGSGLDGEIRTDHGRCLAAQFQRHRCQVACSVSHHCPTRGSRARKQQVIEGQRRECRPAAATVVKEVQLFLREILGADLDQQCGQMTRVLRHLDHRPVACCQDRGQRAERQVEREVPWHDHAHHAQRLGNHAVRSAGKHHHVDVAALRLHPTLEVLRAVLDGFEHHEELGEQGLKLRTTAVVAVDRLDKTVAVVLQQPSQRVQVGQALSPRGLRIGEIGGALMVETLLEFGWHQKLIEFRGACVHVNPPRALKSNGLAQFAPKNLAHRGFGQCIDKYN